LKTDQKPDRWKIRKKAIRSKKKGQRRPGQAAGAAWYGSSRTTGEEPRTKIHVKIGIATGRPSPHRSRPETTCDLQETRQGKAVSWIGKEDLAQIPWRVKEEQQGDMEIPRKRSQRESNHREKDPKTIGGDNSRKEQRQGTTKRGYRTKKTVLNGVENAYRKRKRNGELRLRMGVWVSVIFLWAMAGHGPRHKDKKVGAA